MTEAIPNLKVKHRRKWLLRVLTAFILLVVSAAFYVRTHPLVFNESFLNHAHCLPQAGVAFRSYAADNAGQFPSHTNGYGDALLLLMPYAVTWSVLTGPGYDSSAGRRWEQSGADVPEAECGRVYVQGLTETNNPEIAILFDKIPTPGGDHCHLLRRMRASLSRDVMFIDGSQQGVLESKWPDFSKSQIELLVKDGYDRASAERLYAEKGKVP